MIDLIVRSTIPAALSILPPKMDTTGARAMLVAIGLQESRFLYRRQVNHGPARGFWQFEKAGVRGVMKHEASRGPAREALRFLKYEHLVDEQSFQTADIQYALEDNDMLACVFARLLLWTLPGTMPKAHESALGWAQYLDAWRPGKPHQATWDALFREAWNRVSGEVKE